MSLLDDDQMSRFLGDGFLVLRPPELDAGYHRTMFHAASYLYDEGKRVGGHAMHLQYFGDNLIARLPGIEQLLRCPTVDGALTSILGEGYVLYPHHYVHASSHDDQGFHQDGNLPWNERGHYRSHRPNWAMLFYYPQDVTDENGPTEVVPGSQYWTRDFEHGDRWHPGDPVDPSFFTDQVGAHPDLDHRDRRLAESLYKLDIDGRSTRRLPLPAGSLVLAHYDLAHRGVRQHPDFGGRRYMYKFCFCRTREPEGPSWRNDARLPTRHGPFAAYRPIIERNWAWLRGETPEPSADTARHAGAARLAAAKTEDARMEAAYVLGSRAQCDDEALDELAAALVHERESVRRASGYGLGIAGDRALDVLCAAANHADAPVRRVAVFALGETRSRQDRAIDALATRLADPDDLVRSNAACALGNLGRHKELPAGATGALIDRLDPEAEADNSAIFGMSRSTVRESVAWALLQLATNGHLSASQRERFAELAFRDHDRYVRGLAVKALIHPAAGEVPRWMRPLLAALDRGHYLPSPAAHEHAHEGGA